MGMSPGKGSSAILTLCPRANGGAGAPRHSSFATHFHQASRLIARRRNLARAVVRPTGARASRLTQPFPQTTPHRSDPSFRLASRPVLANRFKEGDPHAHREIEASHMGGGNPAAMRRVLPQKRLRQASRLAPENEIIARPVVIRPVIRFGPGGEVMEDGRRCRAGRPPAGPPARAIDSNRRLSSNPSPPASTGGRPGRIPRAPPDANACWSPGTSVPHSPCSGGSAARPVQHGTSPPP